MSGDLSFFHVTGAVGQVAIQAVKNLHCGVAGDGREIGAGLGRPDHGDSPGARGSVIYPSRTRARYLHGEYLLRERAKRGHGRALLPFRA